MTPLDNPSRTKLQSYQIILLNRAPPQKKSSRTRLFARTQTKEKNLWKSFLQCSLMDLDTAKGGVGVHNTFSHALLAGTSHWGELY